MQVKRFLIFIWVMTMIALSGYSQRTVVFSENFDGATSKFTEVGQLPPTWAHNTTLFQSSPKSIRAQLPLGIGASKTLTSTVIDLSTNGAHFPVKGAEFVRVKFKHICKVSNQDTAIIQYRVPGMSLDWKNIPVANYLGTGTYTGRGFNEASYGSTWGNTTPAAVPDNSWWKEEMFQLNYEVGYERFEIRFLLVNRSGITAYAGWYIDDVEVIADTVDFVPPTLSWNGSPARPTGNLNQAGPYTVAVNAASQTAAPLTFVKLYWTAIVNGVTQQDSADMVNTAGNTYQATISAYAGAVAPGTSVTYRVVARDGALNEATLTGGTYYIVMNATADTAAVIDNFAMPTTIASSNNQRVDIKVLVRNTGRDTLKNATFYWQVNGGAIQSNTSWSNKILPWGFKDTVLLGDYQPRLNKGDVIKVWVSKLNGKTTTTGLTADTLKQLTVTTNAEIAINYQNYPAAIQLNNVGPFEIKAEIVATPQPVSVSLDVETKTTGSASGASTSIPMTQLPYGNVWTATIPQTAFGNTIITKIQLTDSKGNTVTAIDSFALQTDYAVANAVELVEIVSPTMSIPINIPLPLEVKVRNIGTAALSSFTLKWEDPNNPGTILSKVYSGAPIPSGFSEVITLDATYTLPLVHTGDKEIVIYFDPAVNASPADDTIKKTFPTCTYNMINTLTVGAGKQFTTMADAKAAILNCGLSGDLVLEIHGMLNESLDLSNIGSKLNGYKLTLTTPGNDYTAGGLQSNNAFVLKIGSANNKNILISGLTIEATSGSRNAILFDPGSEDIVIRDCHLKATLVPNSDGGDTYAKASGTTNVVYKSNVGGNVNRIYFINNIIEGGYCGISLQAGTSTSQFGTGIVVDSNEFRGNGGRGIYAGFTDFTRIHANKFISTADLNGQWKAVHLNNTNIANITNNWITSTGNNTGGVDAFNFNVLNRYNNPSNAKVLLANNVVSCSFNNGGNAFWMDQTYAEIVHNTIYYYRATPKDDQLLHVGNTPVSFIIKNNIFASNVNSKVQLENNTLSSTQFAGNIYYTSDVRIKIHNVDYRLAQLPAYQTVTGDTTSQFFASMPDFMNAPSDLRLASTENMLVAPYPGLTTDINGKTRYGFTAAGAIEPDQPLLGASIKTILSPYDGIAVGSAPLNVVVNNSGTTTISNIVLGYSFNGAANVTSASLPTNIVQYGKDTFALGNITVPATNNELTLKVWVVSMNGTPNPITDDTMVFKFSSCPTAGFQGPITIGATGQYESVNRVIAKMRACGVTGDVTLEVLSGTYNEQIDLTNTATVLDPYVLTITSKVNNADSVIFDYSDKAILLGNSKNIVIKNITVRSSTSNVSLVFFENTVNNITIRDNKFLANKTSNSPNSNRPQTSAVINKPNNSTFASNVYIINNFIDGGFCGVQFYGNTQSVYGKNFVLDSNRIENPARYGYIFQYIDSARISNNHVITRTANNDAEFNLGNYEYSNGDYIGNRFTCAATNIYKVDGISFRRFNTHNNSSNRRGLIANNANMVFNAAWTQMLIEEARANIFHNTFYVTQCASCSSESVQLFRMSSVGNNHISVRNNIFVIQRPGGTNEPRAVVEFESANITSYKSQYDFGDNIYYTGGSANRLIRHANSWMTLPTWQGFFTTDNSQDILPVWKDGANPVNTLELDANMRATATCPALPEVSHDITGKPRLGVTYVGAYAFDPDGKNVALGKLIDWETETVLNKWVTVKVPVINMGLAPITEVVLSWKVRGIPMGTKTFQLATPLAMYATDTLVVGAFQISMETTKVEVEVVGVNDGTPDDSQADDYTTATTTVVQIAKFANPLVPSAIINASTFDVFVEINGFSGAPATSPLVMQVTKTLNGYSQTFETIAMTQLPDGRWKATVTSQYYGVEVEYKVTVADTCSNVFNLEGRTYLSPLPSSANNSTVIGQGTSSNGSWYLWNSTNYSFSRHLYRNAEFALPGSSQYITDIYFEVGNYATNIDKDLSLWLQATTDLVQQHSDYIDPTSVGATRIFGPAAKTVTTNSWVHFSVNPPFYVPAGQNLMVYCNKENNGFNDITWKYASAPGGFNSSASRYSSTVWPPTGTAYIGPNRINTKIESNLPTFVPYAGADLALVAFAEPINAEATTCGLDVTPVKVVLQNLGNHTYSFPTGAVTINFEVTHPIHFSGSKIVNTGTISSGERMIVDLTSAMPVNRSGSYDLKAWIATPIAGDVYLSDDTVAFTYVSNRLGLPLHFDVSSGELPSFVQETHSNTLDPAFSAPWEVVTRGVVGDDTTNIIEPNGVLMFRGARGGVAKLTTRQLDLAGAAQPELVFYYYHDLTAPMVEDVVRVLYRTSDAGAEIPLQMLYKNDGNPQHDEWVRYQIDLSVLKNESCVFLSIEAYHNSIEDGAQYIKGFQITGMQNLAVTDILAQDLTACDLSSDVKVVLTNQTSQAIDFSAFPTILHFRMDKGGNTTVVDLPLNSGRLENMSIDTFVIAPNYAFTSGTYNVIAFIDDNVDFDQSDDTARATFVVNPLLDVDLIPNTSVGNCAWAKAEHQQSVTIINRGNMDMENLFLTLNVENAVSGSTETIVENLSGLFPAGDSITYQFTGHYTVPEDGDMYYVNITVAPSCNAVLLFSDTIGECIEGRDLSLVELLLPADGVQQFYDDSVYVRVKVKNLDLINSFTNVVLWAVPAGGSPVSQAVGTITEGTEMTVNFTQPYFVPNVAQYILKVYLEAQDGNPKNDTLQGTFNAEPKQGVADYDVAAPYLFQNVPNPAYSVAKVGYSIPADGEVVFNVYSATGQVLSNKTVEVVSGIHSIDFDITNFAAGIYYYSMDYKGQKIVRKMNVQR